MSLSETEKIGDKCTYEINLHPKYISTKPVNLQAIDSNLHFSNLSC